MTTTFAYLPILAVIATAAASVNQVSAQGESDLPDPIVDDFDDGNDAGWTHIDTLGDAGLAEPTVFEFPGGTSFSIDARGTHSFQWARSGAVREDCGSKEIIIEVDVVDFETRNQEIGISGRAEGWGLNKNRAYFLLYNPLDRRLKLWRVAADNPGGISVLKTASVDLGERDAFHLRLEIVGDQFRGGIFSVDDHEIPLATIEATDSEIQGGHCGLSVLAPGSGMQAAATFDNFEAYHPENPPMEEDGSMSIQEVRKLGDRLALTLGGVTESDPIHFLESTDLDIWRENTEYERQPADVLVPLGDEPQGFFRVSRTLVDLKLELTLKGRTVPSTADDCQEIQKHIPEELTEGAVARLYLKDSGAGTHFGKYTSEFALDLFVATVEGFDQPVPVATSGWIIQTQEDGSQTFWHTTSTFNPDASTNVRSEIVWGTSRFEGVQGIVTGLSTPENPEDPTTSPYLYEDSGWIRLAK